MISVTGLNPRINEKTEGRTMKLVIGNDHAAVELKNEIKAYLEEKGHEVIPPAINASLKFPYAESSSENQSSIIFSNISIVSWFVIFR